MTLATKNRSSNFRLKRHLVVPSAVIANDLKALGRFVALACFFRAAFCTALRGHHVALIKDLLLLFREQKGLFTLNARGFYVRHMGFSFFSVRSEGRWRILTHVFNSDATV